MTEKYTIPCNVPETFTPPKPTATLTVENPAGTPKRTCNGSRVIRRCVVNPDIDCRMKPSGSPDQGPHKIYEICHTEQGRYVLDLDTRELTLPNDSSVKLTIIQFKILQDLMNHQGETRSPDILLQGTKSHNKKQIETHIRNIRKKIGNKFPIQTVYGQGYCFAPPPKPQQ